VIRVPLNNLYSVWFSTIAISMPLIKRSAEPLEDVRTKKPKNAQSSKTENALLDALHAQDSFHTNLFNLKVTFLIVYNLGSGVNVDDEIDR
jgi:hypothetical protein